MAVTGIDRSTLAEMIRRMIEKGLLDRERTETDQRANSVRIAAGGKKALRGARAISDRVERSLLAALPASERQKFVRMLMALVEQAERNAMGSEPPSRRAGRAR